MSLSCRRYSPGRRGRARRKPLSSPRRTQIRTALVVGLHKCREEGQRRSCAKVPDVSEPPPAPTTPGPSRDRRAAVKSQWKDEDPPMLRDNLFTWKYHRYLEPRSPIRYSDRALVLRFVRSHRCGLAPPPRPDDPSNAALSLLQRRRNWAHEAAKNHLSLCSRRRTWFHSCPRWLSVLAHANWTPGSFLDLQIAEPLVFITWHEAVAERLRSTCSVRGPVESPGPF